MEITERLKELAHAAADQQWREFSMRVPAEPDRDADLVLMRAAMLIEEMRGDAGRYRWLRERLMAADFDWQESGECALVFAWPKDCAVSGNCDATIDGAMKTQNA